MQTILFLLLLFLIVIFSVLLYFRHKHSRVDKLNRGECPTCGAEPKILLDKENNTQFKVDVVKSKLLQKHGCSGAMEVEYKCMECGLKEVHTQS